jgi:hypothetical protein
MYYEINVSWNGKHWFATAPRSITENSKAYTVYMDMLKRFPPREGFEITVVKWDSHGVAVNVEHWGNP